MTSRHLFLIIALLITTTACKDKEQPAPAEAGKQAAPAPAPAQEPDQDKATPTPAPTDKAADTSAGPDVVTEDATGQVRDLATAEPAEETPEPPPPRIIVARVDGAEVDAGPFLKGLGNTRRAVSDPNQISRPVVERLINDYLLSREAERSGITISDEDVAASLGMEPRLLEKNRKRMTERIRLQRKLLTLARLLEQKGILKEPSPEELRLEYESRRTIRLNAVFFKPDEDKPEAPEQNAREFHKQVTSGEDFVKTAKALPPAQVGKRPFRPIILRGGAPRYKELLAASVDLKEKDIGGPIKTSHGWCVFQVMHRKELQASLKDSEKLLLKKLHKRNLMEGRTRYLKELRKKSRIEYLIDLPSRRRAKEKK